MAVKLDRWEGAEERSRDEVFAELYESSYPSLVKYCRGLVGEEGDPESIAQEAFLRAWMRWERYSTSRPFWALVATIARNLCMDHHRHRRVVDAVLHHRAGELSTSGSSATPDEHLVEDEEYRWASEALSQLCPNHQRLLQLRDVEGLSCEEVAAAEGTSPEAATAALYRARQRLRDAYNKVAAGALAGAALVPLRGVRRRFGLWAHLTGHAASTSPALVARAGETVATVVAIAVVSGAPVVNPISQTSPSERPAGVVTPSRLDGAALNPAAAGAAAKPSAAGTAAAAQAADKGAKKAVVPGATAAKAAVAVAPDDVTFTQFTAAPSSSKTRDVYASGTSTKGCASGACPVLFHSPDGGASWQQLKADGYSGGPVLLATNFPTDKRMFAVGTAGLQSSTDFGATFTTVAPVSGPAAMSPAFSSGEPRILLGGLPGWVYDDDAETTTPLHLDPRPPGHVLSFAYSPGYPKDARLMVGGTKPTDASLQASTVTMCNGDKCGEPVMLPGAEGTPAVLASRSYVGSGQAFAWSGDRLFRSLDGGGHFTPVVLPAKGGVQALAEDTDGALYVAVLATDAKGKTSGGLFVTRDGGKNWAPVGQDTPLGAGATSVASVSHNRLLASAPTGGLLCSADAGKTWAKGCPAAQP